jgi:hypothetical protein
MAKITYRKVLQKCNKHLLYEIKSLNKKILKETNFLFTGQIFPPNPSLVRNTQRILKEKKKLRSEILKVLREKSQKG